VLAFRDPYGIRPAVIGYNETPAGTEYMVASESVAVDALGFRVLRDIGAGEAIFIDEDGRFHSQQCVPHASLNPCIFEYVYLARPDSLIDGASVYEARLNMGEKLAEKIRRQYRHLQIDVVIPIPDSSRPSGLQLATALGVPYREGFVKNRYIGRTFIQPHQRQREAGVDLKFNPLPEVLRDRRIALVDDSIVRGTTTPRIVAMLRRAGAAEVHLRICAPPIRYACHLGVDTAPEETLIANTHSVEEITRLVGADSLGYLSLDGLVRAIGLESNQLCNACFHGRYPMPIEALDKLALEPSGAGRHA
jgi:amidophosphoribosyltransferase